MKSWHPRDLEGCRVHPGLEAFLQESLHLKPGRALGLCGLTSQGPVLAWEAESQFHCRAPGGASWQTTNVSHCAGGCSFAEEEKRVETGSVFGHELPRRNRKSCSKSQPFLDRLGELGWVTVSSGLSFPSSEMELCLTLALQWTVLEGLTSLVPFPLKPECQCHGPRLPGRFPPPLVFKS